LLNFALIKRIDTLAGASYINICIIWQDNLMKMRIIRRRAVGAGIAVLFCNFVDAGRADLGKGVSND